MTTTMTRSATSTCTKSRVDAVLDLFCGDLVAFICEGLLRQETSERWLRDISDVLCLEALDRFQLKITPPGGQAIALDYRISDDGRIKGSATSGGFSTGFIPKGSTVSIVVRWRTSAPKLAEARKLLSERGWGTGTLITTTGDPERAYADGGYGLERRFAGDWKK